jgi:peroxiredoxin
MNKMYIIGSVVLLLSLSSTQAADPRAKTFRIRFVTRNLSKGTKAYLVYQTNGEKYVDSATVRNDTMEFTGTIQKNLPATVVLDPKNLGMKMLMKKSSAEILDFLKIYLCEGLSEAITDHLLANARFKGPGINYDFQVLQDHEKQINEQWASVSKKLIIEKDTAKLRMLKRSYDSLNRARLPILKKFILTNPGSIIALVAWEDYKGYLLQFNGMIRNDIIVKEASELFNLLSPVVKNAEEAIEARRFFYNSSELKPGMIAPEFSQPDADGRIVNLSDFRGKYLLLDLWASWCGPCRENGPALKALYNEFKGESFEILGISLDEKEGRTKWLQAIDQDGLIWPQISDLQHWDNAVVKLYTIPAIPYYLLIGPDGRIVTHNESVEALHKQLRELLGAKR